MLYSSLSMIDTELHMPYKHTATCNDAAITQPCVVMLQSVILPCKQDRLDSVEDVNGMTAHTCQAGACLRDVLDVEKSTAQPPTIKRDDHKRPSRFAGLRTIHADACRVAQCKSQAYHKVHVG